ncbi:hypothetical protein [Geochorda subterranea]|uniref:DUF5683 domain-containing protein n=1 Tax=Geochorda subterranea TaxID=3109564 RepID=A0ABZ1BMK2_9FIRM|nr:hypothetical protein [Limnochorda sp. LNt]WRP13803.1 hypothetical protein VLY81_10200 [Limnochorda sp. LNt]
MNGARTGPALARERSRHEAFRELLAALHKEAEWRPPQGVAIQLYGKLDPGLKALRQGDEDDSERLAGGSRVSGDKTHRPPGIRSSRSSLCLGMGGVAMNKAIVAALLGVALWVGSTGPAFAQATANGLDSTALVHRLLEAYRQEQGHFTLGLDILTIGSIRKDRALGYPRSAIGANLGLGVTWRNYSLPSELEVQAAAERVATRYAQLGLDLTWDEYRREVRRALDRSWFRYFGVNTMALIIPAVEFGWTYDTAGVSGTGAGIDVGVLWGLSTLLFPAPYVGVTYSF